MASNVTTKRRDAIDRFHLAVSHATATMTDLQRAEFQRVCGQLLNEDRLTTRTIECLTEIMQLLV